MIINKDLALIAAIKLKEIKKALELLEAGANPDVLDQTSNPAIILAVEIKSFRLVKALILKKADLNRTDLSGNTALMKAVGLGSYKIVKLLVDNRVNLLIRNKDDISVLSCLKGKSKKIFDFISQAYDNSPEVKAMQALVNGLNDSKSEKIAEPEPPKCELPTSREKPKLPESSDERYINIQASTIYDEPGSSGVSVISEHAYTKMDNSHNPLNRCNVPDDVNALSNNTLNECRTWECWSSIFSKEQPFDPPAGRQSENQPEDEMSYDFAGWSLFADPRSLESFPRQLDLIDQEARNCVSDC